jgi:hypothetical protein
MASKRATRRRSCQSKVRHADYYGAMIAYKRFGAQDRIGLRIYKCGFCGGYHIGHIDRATAFLIAERRGA